MKMAGRVQALEGRLGALPRGEVHWVIRHAPQTRDKALDEFGRDKIGPEDDLVFFRVGFGKLESTSRSA